MKVHEHQRKRKIWEWYMFQNPSWVSDNRFSHKYGICNLFTGKCLGHFRVPPGLCMKTRLSAQPSFWSHANKTHFHKKGCALGLVLKVKVFGSRKWLICCPGLGHLYLLFNAPPWGIFSFSTWQMPDKCPGGGNGQAWNWLSHKCWVWLCVSFRRKT